ncbi:MAG: hypothetical protein K5930_02945 [Treponemataceae bacterium]|nr:hypothetical protein [Treponemataceae bacterium]
MTENQWEKFVVIREDFKQRVKSWDDALKKVKTMDGTSFALLQKKLASADGVPDYPLENGVVYNTAFDSFTAESSVKLIVVGDNPGKSEQLNKNRMYLIGQSGKIAEGFFRNHAELGIDFRKDVLVLNKTPVHTAKTKELVQLCKLAGKEAADIVAESQKYMADLAFQLQQLFSCEIWIVGYGELKAKGIFIGYRDYLYGLYAGNDVLGSTNAECGKMNDFEKSVFVYQHFSMNRFSIDLKSMSENFCARSGVEGIGMVAGGVYGRDLRENLHEVGKVHRKEIFGR